jgi:hypothetical protein
MLPLFINRWVLIALVVLTALLAFFWHDLVEQSGDSMHGFLSSTVVHDEVSASDLEHAHVRYGRKHNDPAQIEVSDIQFESRSVGQSIVSARMISSVDGNDYPHLLVVMSAEDGHALRTVDLAPSEYEHGSAPSDERVRFNVEVQDGERRIRAHASYPGEPVAASFP